jgi:hypothetical protein
MCRKKVSRCAVMTELPISPGGGVSGIWPGPSSSCLWLVASTTISSRLILGIETRVRPRGQRQSHEAERKMRETLSSAPSRHVPADAARRTSSRTARPRRGPEPRPVQLAAPGASAANCGCWEPGEHEGETRYAAPKNCTCVRVLPPPMHSWCEAGEGGAGVGRLDGIAVIELHSERG